MPVPSALVTRFFQLIASRQFTEAERELERVKQKMQKTEWNRGYFRALYGIFLTRKANGDSYALLSKMDFDDKPSLHSYRREFLGHVRNRLHGDFDRGFFSAWADCMRVFSRIQVPHNVNVPNATNETPAEEQPLETVKTDKNQATMANFIKDEAQA
jgi:hypothetical protein